MPGPSWPPVLAAVFTAAFFLGLTVKLYMPSFACGVLAVAMVIWWMWDTDPGPVAPSVDIGGGMKLPTYVTGAMSHSWWAMIVLELVAATTFACILFSYFFLWTVSPRVWPSAAGLPSLAWPAASAGLYLVGSVIVVLAGRWLARVPQRSAWPLRIALVLAVPLLAGAVAAEVLGQLATGLRPHESAYGAIVYTVAAFQGFFAVVLAIMALYTVARSLAGRLDGVRRATFDNTALFWHYTTAQGLVGLLIVHAFPRLLS
jgi:cytochrome c oxidase subunit I+III